MGELLVKEFNSDAEKADWDKFVDESYSGDIIQFWEWGETKRDQGWKPLRLAVIEDGKMVLAALCLLKKAGLLGDYLYIGHGPVFNDKKQLAINLLALVDYLKAQQKKLNIFTIEIEPRFGKVGKDENIDRFSSNLKPLVDREIEMTILSAGFKKTRRNMQPVYKLYYDLGLTEDELKAMMKKNTRYNIGLAERKGVVVNEYRASDPNIAAKIDEFYDLMLDTQVRAKGYPIRPKSTFVKLFQEFKDRDNLVLFEAKFDNKLIAMNITERVKYWSSSFYAGSNRLFTEVKAPYLMRWKSILSNKNYGSRLYDFWGIIPNSKQHQGYSDNKLSFGGVAVENYGIFAYPLISWKYKLWELFLKVRKTVSQK